VNDLVFDPLAKTPKVPSALSYDSIAGDEQGFFIVQFNGPVKDSMRRSLESTGTKILYYISYNAFVVRADAHAIDLAGDLSTVRWTGVFEPAYKISPNLSERFDEVIRRATDDSSLASSAGSLLSYGSSVTAEIGTAASGSTSAGYSPSHLSDVLMHPPLPRRRR